MYVNEDWSANVRDTADAVANGSDEAEADDKLADAMRQVAQTPTAVWMDSISAIEGNNDGPGLRHHLDAALEQAADGGQMIVTVVIYDLPGRDCFALASNGELPATDDGLARYQSEYVDVIADMLAEDKYADLRVATIIEPDSLPNLVTNASDAACQSADPYYREGVAYVLDAFARLDNVYSYIDAGHSGWLGWESNADPTAELFADVVQSTEAGFDSVDGFATNTANYSPLEEPYLPNPQQRVAGQAISDGSFYESNVIFDEADWTADLHARLVAAGFPDSVGMLIDTSRNGWGGKNRPTAPASATSVDTFVSLSKVDGRTNRGAWCNQDGAGIGRLPQALPDGYPDSHLDALVWIKVPGESDGSSSEINNDEGKSFDPMCDPTFSSGRLAGNTTNALPDAPLSGTWFEAQFSQLVANAYPKVGEPVPPPREDPDATKPAVASSAQPSVSPTPDATEPEPSASASVKAVGCTADLEVVHEWSSSFEAHVTVTADDAITGWTVGLTFPPGTSTKNLWNGDNSGTSGSFVVNDMGFNGTLAPGESVEFGFVGDGDYMTSGPVPCEAR